jgi:mRNA interferase MazF
VIRPADVLLARFPFTDLTSTKLRPVVVLAPVPGPHDDYLVVFVSTQVQHAVDGVDILLGPTDAGFSEAGFKTTSVVRIGKIAALARAVLVGRLGVLPANVFRSVIDRHVALLRGEL